jgi:hypothetical protein
MKTILTNLLLNFLVDHGLDLCYHLHYFGRVLQICQEKRLYWQILQIDQESIIC